MAFLALVVIATIGFILVEKQGWIQPNSLVYETPYLCIWIGSDYGLGIRYTPDNRVISVLVGFIDICIYLGR